MSKILIDRSTVEQALEALETLVPTKGPSIYNSARDALRTALAQQDESEAYGYASRLAVAIWEKNYKDIAPQWKPLDYLIGVLTQIDNMTSGLTRQAQQVEPVAWLYTGIKQDSTEHGPHLVWSPEYMDAMSASKGAKATPLYTAPPQRKPLTKEQFLYIYNQLPNWGMDMDSLPQGLEKFGREVELAHGIGEQP